MYLGTSDTCWNSVYLMADRYKNLIQYFSTVIREIERPTSLNPHEEAVLEDLIRLLEPIEDLTTKFSGCYYPTSSMVIPYHSMMIVDIESVACSTQIGRNFQQCLLQAFQERF